MEDVKRDQDIAEKKRRLAELDHRLAEEEGKLQVRQTEHTYKARGRPPPGSVVTL